MPILFQDTFFNHLYELLSELYDAARNDYAYDWNGYADCANELVDALASDVNKAVQFINSLDFNNETDKHILHFIPKVIDKLTTFGEKVVIASCLNAIPQNYPQVQLGGLSFHTILSLGTHLDGSL